MKDFKRIALNPGESKKVTFEVTPEMLSMYDHDMNLFVEPGEFKVMIGSSSRDIKLISKLVVE